MSRTPRLPYFRHAAIAVAAAGVLAAFTPQVVVAQMMDSYRFQARDRASIAFGMRNAENPPRASAASAGSVTQLVCGSGEGGSTAAGSTANSSCVILNNVAGGVDVGQDSVGDQNANASAETSGGASMSDALDTLAE